MSALLSRRPSSKSRTPSSPRLFECRLRTVEACKARWAQASRVHGARMWGGTYLRLTMDLLWPSASPRTRASSGPRSAPERLHRAETLACGLG